LAFAEGGDLVLRSCSSLLRREFDISLSVEVRISKAFFKSFKS
jgi:hypothetical protein